MAIWVFFMLIVVLHVVPVVFIGRSGIKESKTGLGKVHAEELVGRKWYIQHIAIQKDSLELRVSSVDLVDGGGRERHTLHFRPGSTIFSQVLGLGKMSIVVFTLHDPRCPEQATDPGDHLYIHHSFYGHIAQ